MILVKTEAGHQVVKDRSIRLTPRQRSALILFDGKRMVDQVLAAGVGVSRGDIDALLDLGLLSMPGGPGEASRPTHSATAQVIASSTKDMLHGSSPMPLTSPSQAPPLDVVPSTPSTGNPSASVPQRSDQQRFKDAYPIATLLTGSLGLRGLRLNLSVEGARNFDELLALAPKIRAAVGPDKAALLDRALTGD